MLLLDAPVFSLTKELTVFGIFVAIVIILTILVEIEYGRAKRKLPAKPQHSDFFNKVEEYRHDFDDHR